MVRHAHHEREKLPHAGHNPFALSSLSKGARWVFPQPANPAIVLQRKLFSFWNGHCDMLHKSHGLHSM